MAGKKGNKNKGKNVAPKAITKAKSKVNKPAVVSKNEKKAKLVKEAVKVAAAKPVAASPKTKKGKAKPDAKVEIVEQETPQVALAKVESKNKGKKGKKAVNQQVNNNKAASPKAKGKTNVAAVVPANNNKVPNKKKNRKGKNKPIPAEEAVTEEGEEEVSTVQSKGKKGKKKGANVETVPATNSEVTTMKVQNKKKGRTATEESIEEPEDQETASPIGKRASKRSIVKNGTEEAKKQKIDDTEANGKKQDAKKRRFTLFVGNLAFATTPEDIEKHFSKAGNISNVRLMYDKSVPKKSKGFGYIELTDKDTYEKCASMHHTMLGNRRINVEYTGDPNESKTVRNVKNAKLSALRKKGMLLGSKKDSQKRSTRRKNNKNK